MSELVSINKEWIEVSRDTTAIGVPEGTRTIIKAGTHVVMVHELGGDFTVRTEVGAIFRLDRKDGDAIGRTPSEPVASPIGESVKEVTEDAVWDVARTCYDPEIPVNIVDMGLIYGVKLNDSEAGVTVKITMTLTAPGCGMGQVIADDVKRKVEGLGGVAEVEVDLTFDPPWEPSRMSESARLEMGML